tara:strand:- start:200 stop:475 length:276 start_codon:yes stop_codon:yes gene_type:complete
MVQPNYKTRLNRQQRHATSVYDPYGMNRQGKALTQQRGTKLKQDLAIAGTVFTAGAGYALYKHMHNQKGVKPFQGYVAPPLQASSGTVGFD